MKALLIVVAVAIVMALVVFLSVYIGCIIGVAGFTAIVEDCYNQEIIPDKAQSYSPDMANIENTFKENMQILLKEHILTRVLIRRFKNKK